MSQHAVPTDKRATRPAAPRRTLPVTQYDVRLRRELAHRRLIRSLFRRGIRLTALHVLDASILVAVAKAIGATGTAPRGGTLFVWVAAVLLALDLRAAYRPATPQREAFRIVTAVLLAGIALLALTAALPPTPHVSTVVLAIALAMAAAGLILERRIVERLLRKLYAHGIGLRNALVVSLPQDYDRVLAGLSAGAIMDQRVVGYVTPDPGNAANTLGSLRDLDEVLDREAVEEVVVAAPLSRPLLRQLSQRCFDRGIHVLVIPLAAQVVRGWAEPVRLGTWPAYNLHPSRLEIPSLVVKRVTDMVLATIGLVVAAPLIALIAIAIKIDSRGPVFFRQRRVGLGGREFMMWKFRSMSASAEEMQGEIAHLNPYGDDRLFKLRADPRITRVGRFLRRFSLDELPQILNVIAGEMSLVGPRPPLPSEVSRYEPRHRVRLTVVPGLTGPWQVSGRNLITDFEEVVRLEQRYIETWSLAADLRIMLRTVGVVLSGEGAY